MEDLLVPLGALWIGLLVGLFSISRVASWVLAVYSAARSSAQSSVSKGLGIVSAMFLASGPWLLVALALIAFYVRAKPWALWAYSGLGIAIIWVAAMSFRLARKARARAA